VTHENSSGPRKEYNDRKRTPGAEATGPRKEFSGRKRTPGAEASGPRKEFTEKNRTPGAEATGHRRDFRKGRVTRETSAGPRKEFKRGNSVRDNDSGPRREFRKGKDVAGAAAGPRKEFKRGKATPKPEAEPVRLNKYIANSGVCARREADELIKQGYITVNGKKVTDMGIKVKPSDKVEYRGKRLTPGNKVYILINKPKGYVTTVKDPHAENTVLDLVKDATTERIYPVGRLDKATTGVLLLTNDGDLAGKLTHPSYGARKIYHVFLDRDVTRHDMETIVEGVELEDGKVSADAVSYADTEDHTQVGIELHSGQNRVVRRIFEKLGYKVRKLDRVSFAGLTKKNLQRGHWRHLTAKEISMLKRGIYK
jgi:23S rRNA pseudouridine2605 synthase